MEEKTNVMRILEQKKIPFQVHSYANSGAVNGREVAAILGIEPKRVFKTLVTTAKSGRNHVFVVPVEEKLDLKKAAKIVGEKLVEMLKEKELLPLTGYVHGGCLPIVMKKFFPTVIDQTAESFASILVNAGKIGYQIEISVGDLARAIPIRMADLKV